jgi:hypothetical protein
MNALLIRVGADQSAAGGRWNGPVDSASGEFVYVAIPESTPVHTGHQKPYIDLQAALAAFGHPLPSHLMGRHMHLDPDFSHLTYGDQGERARQLRAQLNPGDWAVFYASLVDVRQRGWLVYALIGLLVVEQLVNARDVPVKHRDTNAHTRRMLPLMADDVVVLGRPGASGRLRECLPIGEWRSNAYRVRQELLGAWGGLSVRDGWLQRSARLPRFLAPDRFRAWFEAHEPLLVQANNP